MSTISHQTASLRLAVLALAAMAIPIAFAASGQDSRNGFSNSPHSQANPSFAPAPGTKTGVELGGTPPGGAATEGAGGLLLDSAVDSAGNVYTADAGRYTIRKTAPNGSSTTLAGREGFSGSADGTGSAAQFNGPKGIAVDASGNVYVADSNNHTIRKVNYGGVVTTLAGSAGMSGNADGMGADARFSSPQGVAVDARGNVYVADSKNNSVRKITPMGVVTTLAGAGFPGYADGVASESRFYYPTRVAVDPIGNLFVADTGNHLIRKVSASGAVTTLAGGFTRQPRGAPVGGYADGTGTAARFNSPQGIMVDPSGNVLVADAGNQKIRKVSAEGVVTTVQESYSPGQQRRDVLVRVGHRTLGRDDDRCFSRRFDGRRGDGRTGSFTGTFIYGGLPSPGDIDARFGRLQQLNQRGGDIIIGRSNFRTERFQISR